MAQTLHLHAVITQGILSTPSASGHAGDCFLLIGPFSLDGGGDWAGHHFSHHFSHQFQKFKLHSIPHHVS